MIEDFENVCGEAPKDTENLNFQVSDPNFVFENDPNFESLRLFDFDGNVVNVNSWLECANYVNGGWTNNISDFTSYGFGFRIKSILGPFNFMWTKTNDELYNQSKNNYFFSLGIDY